MYCKGYLIVGIAIPMLRLDQSGIAMQDAKTSDTSQVPSTALSTPPHPAFDAHMYPRRDREPPGTTT